MKIGQKCKYQGEILCEILQPLEKVPDGGRGGVGEKFRGGCMEDGGVDTTFIDSWLHKKGQMADLPPLLASLVSHLKK